MELPSTVALCRAAVAAGDAMTTVLSVIGLSILAWGDTIIV